MVAYGLMDLPSSSSKGRPTEQHPFVVFCWLLFVELVSCPRAGEDRYFFSARTLFFTDVSHLGTLGARETLFYILTSVFFRSFLGCVCALARPAGFCLNMCRAFFIFARLFPRSRFRYFFFCRWVRAREPRASATHSLETWPSCRETGRCRLASGLVPVKPSAPSVP